MLRAGRKVTNEGSSMTSLGVSSRLGWKACGRVKVRTPFTCCSPTRARAAGCVEFKR